MKFTIHDVGHGMCVSLTDGNRTALWDCGHKDGHRPSHFLPKMGISQIDAFFVTNYDEDHISDLPNLRNEIYIKSLFRNKSISKEELRELKRKGGPISDAMESLLDMISQYTLPLSPSNMGADFSVYHNEYSDFQDTNNLSLVSFVNIGSAKFIIPGDLEKAGWEKLLENPSFQEKLKGVNVFIASHHGRENGYCKEVFDFCKPHVVIICDSVIKYGTQEDMSSIYGKHAKGIQYMGRTRYVLSTRNDGSLSWEG